MQQIVSETTWFFLLPAPITYRRLKRWHLRTQHWFQIDCEYDFMKKEQKVLLWQKTVNTHSSLERNSADEAGKWLLRGDVVSLCCLGLSFPSHWISNVNLQCGWSKTERWGKTEGCDQYNKFHDLGIFKIQKEVNRPRIIIYVQLWIFIRILI